MPEIEELSREELLAVISAQAEVITQLQAKIAELERKLSRNSKNSSNPPSTDDIAGRKAPERVKRKQSGRKRGKQPGAPGQNLPWREDPDEHEPHVPEGRCECGADLADARDLGVEWSLQEHDIPLVTVKIVQHDMHRTRCSCGCEHTGQAPTGLGAGPVCYGLNIQALAAYLLVFQHVPVERCAQLIADISGVEVSTGFVHSMLARGAARLADVVAKIKAAITLAHVVGFDETTVRSGPAGVKQHVWSANTELLSAYYLGGRDLRTAHAFGVLDGFGGIAVHDRYALYDSEEFANIGGHQLCSAHILRDLADAEQTYPDHDWPKQISGALRALIHAQHASLDAGQDRIAASLLRHPVRQFRQGVADGLALVPRVPGDKSKQLPGRCLLECLHAREGDVLRFTTDNRIWPTNNISERSLRPEKTQQKISGRLQSQAVTRHRLDIRSYLVSARKNGIDMMTAMRDAFAGNPWTPRVPAPG